MQEPLTRLLRDVKLWQLQTATCAPMQYLRELTRVLFPEQHVKLPATKEAYHSFRGFAAEEFLVEADDSVVPAMVTSALYAFPAAPVSEMHTTSFISGCSLTCLKL